MELDFIRPAPFFFQDAAYLTVTIVQLHSFSRRGVFDGYYYWIIEWTHKNKTAILFQGKQFRFIVFISEHYRVLSTRSTFIMLVV